MQNKVDKRLLIYFSILILFGLIALTSVSSAVGYAKFSDSYYFIKHQFLFGFLPGLILFFIAFKFNYRDFKKLSFLIYIFTIILLVMVLIPGLGTNYGTAARSWFVLAGFSFQPSELAKLALIIYMAAYLSTRGNKLINLEEGFLPALFMGIIPIFLVVLEPDIGTASIAFAILFGMLFVAQTKLKHIIGLMLVGVVAFILLVTIAPYRAARLTTFMHPELDPQGIGYQVNQAFLAIGSGGILGRGYGQSLQKFQYLPEVESDSIFAVIAEELGLISVVGFIILWILIIRRSFILAKEVEDSFARLLICGIIIWFGVQTFLNIGAMVGVLPLTGVPLPFVSHGGSALAIGMAAVGILLNVSSQSRT